MRKLAEEWEKPKSTPYKITMWGCVWESHPSFFFNIYLIHTAVFFSYFFFVLFLLFVLVVLGCIWCSLSMAKESSSLPFAPSTFHSMLSDCGGHPSPAPPPLGISVACEGPLLMHCALRLLSSCVLNANACVGEGGWCGRERLLRLYMSCELCCALLYCLFRRQGDR